MPTADMEGRPMRSRSRSDAVLAAIERTVLYGAAIAFAAMMIITVIDIVMRYFLNSPLGWSSELFIYYLLPAGFFLAISDTLRENGHIKLTLMDSYVSVKTRWWMSLVGHAASAVFIAFVLVTGLTKTAYKWQMQDAYPGYILWPVWLSAIFVPIGFGLLELRILQRIYILVSRRRRTRYAIVDEVERTHEDNEVTA